MRTVCDNNGCNGCMACVDICPTKCISIKDEIRHFNAIIDATGCIGCKQCEKMCPNIENPGFNDPVEWHQGWTCSEIRDFSSSGGIASAIIKSFIESGGYVASCLFEEGEFRFDITNNIEIAKKFAGSKYVKSNPLGIYQKVKERLKTDKVLFVGLPCQVAALKNYIKNKDNLFTIDLICHGTPSPKLLKKFLDENKIDIYKVKNISFRTKNKFGISVDGERICKSGKDDYLLTFLDSVGYTDNCYSCQFARFERTSDLTLGDSWGTEYTEEEARGVSLILVTSDKGKELLNSAELVLKEVDISNAKKQNHQLRHPSRIKSEREKFLKLIEHGESFSWATFSIYKKTVLKRFIKDMLIKVGLKRE